MRHLGWITLALVAILAGCSTKPVPPPEPDMAKLVKANEGVPTPLRGKVGLFDQGSVD